MPSYRIDAYFDGERFVRQPSLLRVERGVVHSICERSEAPPAEWEAASPHLQGTVLIPLLADAHIHGFLDPWPIEPDKRKPAPNPASNSASKPAPDPFAQALRRVSAALSSGVGLLRDGGDPHGVNMRVRSECERSKGRGLPIPYYLVPGPALHAPGRYGSFLGRAVGDRAAMKETVEALALEGVDFVKVIATGIIDFRTGVVKGRPQFDDGDLAYLVGLCHDRGLKVMAHASGREGVAQAVAAGVDTIEHGYFVDFTTLGRMAERGVAWTPTLAPVWVQAEHFEACGWDGKVRDLLRSILQGHLEAIGRAVELGVTVLTGSDAGAPGVDQAGGIHLELELMQGAGLSADALLAMTSQVTPRALGARPLPALRPGERAFAIAAPLRVMEEITAIREAERLLIDGELAPFAAPRVHPEPGGSKSQSKGAMAT